MKKTLSILCATLFIAGGLAANESTVMPNPELSRPAVYAPANGANFGMDKVVLASGVVVIGGLTAIVIATGNGTSAH